MQSGKAIAEGELGNFIKTSSVLDGADGRSDKRKASRAGCRPTGRVHLDRGHGMQKRIGRKEVRAGLRTRTAWRGVGVMRHVCQVRSASVRL